MTDLRKASEMALNYFESAYELDSHEIEIREALRQALAQPVDAVNMTQERVDETAKRKHEWVGLTDEDFYGQSKLQVITMKYAEAKLKKKNGK